jgi:hypothetical protein
MREDVGGEDAFEARHGTDLSGVEERPLQPVAGRPLNGLVPWLGEVRAGSAPELPRVGFADLERLGDLAERVVECLAEHEDGAFCR